MRLLKYDNVSNFCDIGSRSLLGVNSLNIWGGVIPGSISFNGVAVVLQKVTNSSLTVSVYFGLYSRTGSTLSLANSASGSLTFGTAQAQSWMTLATSATQDITPGNWYLAVMSNTSNDSRISLMCYNNQATGALMSQGYGGHFVRGWHSASQSAMPASIATSDLVKEGEPGSVGTLNHPYVLISS